MGNLVVFNGTVMRGQPAHANIAGATFLAEVRTAAAYRLYSIDDQYPAMVRDDTTGFSIAAELYRVPDEIWPEIRDSEPPGLYRGPVELDDGRWVEGMLGATELIKKRGSEITSYGGWVEYCRRGKGLARHEVRKAR